MKAVILAAGRGTRLHPITLTRPKHLVPVGGKPIVDHTLDALKSLGINEVVLVVNYSAEQLKRHLGDGGKYGMKFEYSYQKDLLGTAHAANFAEPYVTDDFLLIYGDWMMTPEEIEKVIKIHEREKPAATMGVVPVDDPSHYGVVRVEDSQVKAILEKPDREKAPTNLVNVGIYVFSMKIFDAISRTEKSQRGEFELTDAISILISEKCKILAVQLSNMEVLDVGLIWDLLEANKWALEKTRPKIHGDIEDSAHLIGPVIVEENARIRSGAYIEGPVFIGEGSDIGPNCFIRPYTSIGKHVRIGNACEIKNSIILDKTHIGHLSYFGDSIIGENCNFGAGTVIANFRFNGQPVKMHVKNSVSDTGRRKLGVVVGDDTKTGVNVSIMPGVKLGNNSWIGPNVLVYRDIPPNKTVFLKQETREKNRLKS